VESTIQAPGARRPLSARVLEYTLLRWQDGERRLGEHPSRERRALDRVVERIVAELRRRLGSTFSAQELAELYEGSQAWTMALAVQAAPAEPVAWEQWVADAAFKRYLRGASDWPPRRS
jgi:hypothetical protein